MKRRTSADDVKRVAVAALNTVLDDSKREVTEKPGLTGVRAVATGAVLYTAGRAAFAGRRFYRDRFASGSNGAAGEEEAYYEDEDEYDEDELEDEDEPEAEADEDEYEDED